MTERSDLEVWLEPRLAHAPAELAEAVRELLDAATGAGVARAAASSSAASVADLLADAALAGFADVVSDTAAGGRPRGAALRLLAADAVLTYAFEAAADLGLDVVSLADRLGPAGALGELMRSPEVA